MKICKICNKEVTVFHGHGMCDKCYRQEYKRLNPTKDKEYYENNKEKWDYSLVDKNLKRIRDKKYARKNKDKIKINKKDYQEKNKEITKERKKEYYENNKEELLEDGKKRRQNRTPEEIQAEREYQKEYRKNNIEKIKENGKEYRKNNKEKIQEKAKKDREKNRERNNTNVRNRRKTDPYFRMICNLRGRNRKFFTRTVKKYHTKQLLNCDEQFFLNHFISRFKEGMTLENYGKVWHIDHIIPLNWFDPTNEEDKLIACNIFNLQPLFGPENDAKHDNLPNNYLEILAIIKQDLAKKIN